MSGGGGSAAPVQDNSLAVAQFQAQQAQQQQARQDAKDAQAKTDFSDALSKAVTGARATGTNELTNLGLDPSKYGNIIDQVISDAQAKVPNLDPNPGQYFTSDQFDLGVQNATNQVRLKNTTAVNSAFAPGFESGYIPDSATSKTIDDILNEQYGQAQQQVDFNRARGTINDQGYATAQQKLASSRAAGAAQLGDIGTSVLGKDRAQLDAIKGDAGTAAGQYALGQPDFSVDPYKQKADSTAQDLVGNIGGAVRNAVGSTNYFDIPSILTSAGIAQGPQNLTTIAPTGASPGVVKKNPNVDRGLGSTGGF